LDKYNTPAEFGGSKEEGKKMLEEAVKKYDAFKPESSIHPKLGFEYRQEIHCWPINNWLDHQLNKVAMQEENLSPEQSLKLIQSMINKTKQDMSDNGIYFSFGAGLLSLPVRVIHSQACL